MLLKLLRNLILPIKAINEHLPVKGVIYEVGCGYGSLAYAVAKNWPNRYVIGIDINKNKIAQSKKNNKLTNLKFINSDINKYNFKKCQGIIMSDFLHHIDYITQEKIIKLMKNKLFINGRLVIKEIDMNDGVLMWLSRLWDFILYPNDEIYYRSKNNWKTLFEKNQFEVKIYRKSIFFPGSTHLFVCTKK